MRSSDRILRSFLPALYPVAALLVIAPLTDVVGAVGQVSPGQASWRFGVLGVGLNSLVAQTMGMALALGVAAWLGHRRVLRTVSGLTLVMAVLIVAGIARFVMDFGQVQEIVAAADRAALDAATFRALILASLAVPVLVVLGGKGWVASAISPAEPDSTGSPARPRVIPFPGRVRAPDARWPR